MNKKGMTLVEVIVSIVLVSIILVFITRLLITVNGLYKRSKLEVDFEILDTLLIDAIESDINRYGVREVNSDSKSITFTFNAYRESKLDEYIVKKLSLTDDGSYIKYEQVSTSTPLTSDERANNFVRKIPDGAILDTTNCFINNELYSDSTSKLYEIKFKIMSSNGNDFTANIFYKTLG